MFILILTVNLNIKNTVAVAYFVFGANSIT